ncbi:hypothetical protein SCHPADRAFT_376367 [Schizopora paradoxa]|uniref:Uncharacterized protein n=1 Tax=Schizopora paradoxa TaxID=27342 RepID=A0A0H2RMM7_9AGAM|nr:hypothetical protein SCHPADRAFT_376367 [Schizopora paradoxa]
MVAITRIVDAENATRTMPFGVGKPGLEFTLISTQLSNYVPFSLPQTLVRADHHLAWKYRVSITSMKRTQAPHFLGRISRHLFFLQAICCGGESWQRTTPNENGTMRVLAATRWTPSRRPRPAVRTHPEIPPNVSLEKRKRKRKTKEMLFRFHKILALHVYIEHSTHLERKTQS